MERCATLCFSTWLDSSNFFKEEGSSYFDIELRGK
jgi:hypothetical protein